MQRDVTTFLCSSIVLFIPLACFAQKPAATLEIQMQRSEFKAGTAIRLDVALTNASTEDLRVSKAFPQVNGQAEAYLSVKVVDAESKSLPRMDGVTIVKNGKEYTIGKRWLTRKGVIVRPSQEVHDFLLLSRHST
jgi:hypothetical protein